MIRISSAGSGPALAARNIPSVRTSTLADIAGLFLLTHDPHDLGRGEAAEIGRDKRAIAPVVLERVQQFIAKIFDAARLVSRDRRLGRFRLLARQPCRCRGSPSRRVVRSAGPAWAGNAATGAPHRVEPSASRQRPTDWRQHQRRGGRHDPMARYHGRPTGIGWSGLCHGLDRQRTSCARRHCCRLGSRHLAALKAAIKSFKKSPARASRILDRTTIQ
jgi:hypothetical protein